jgi:hypothetical protein
MESNRVARCLLLRDFFAAGFLWCCSAFANATPSQGIEKGLASARERIRAAARAYDGRTQARQAVAELDTWIGENGDAAEAYLLLGEALTLCRGCSAEHAADAVAALSRAAHLGPADPWAVLPWAERVPTDPEAQRAVDRLLRERPSHPGLLYAVARRAGTPTARVIELLARAHGCIFGSPALLATALGKLERHKEAFWQWKRAVYGTCTRGERLWHGSELADMAAARLGLVQTALVLGDRFEVLRQTRMVRWMRRDAHLPLVDARARAARRGGDPRASWGAFGGGDDSRRGGGRDLRGRPRSYEAYRSCLPRANGRILWSVHR